MQIIAHPVTGKTYKLGRRPSAPARRLRLGAYLKATELPAPPRVCHYSLAVEHGLEMCLGNDNLSDCTAAGAAHLVDLWRGNASVTASVVSEADTLAFYSKTTGYVPGDAATDQGGDLLTIMQKWRDGGFFADGSGRISGWAAVDATNKVEVKTALWLFEGLYMGAALPDAWLNPMPAATGFVWGVAGESDPDNGHCTTAVGYNDIGAQVNSWGMIGTMTWAALAKYYTDAAGGELYALLSPDAINRATAKAASGFDIAALTADLAALR